MSKSEREKRELQRQMRRSRRLAERAERRARRKKETAYKVADRAQRLAEKARRRAHGFEDKVDDIVERTEDWLTGQDDDRRYSDSERPGESERSQERSTRTRSASERRRRARRSRVKATKLPRRKQTGLYRDKDRGKVCGVCAGVADYFNIDPWQTRIVALAGLFFMPQITVPIYFIAYFAMDDKPYYRRVTDRYEEPEKVSPHTEEVSEEPRSTSPEVVSLADVRARFEENEQRLRVMESYVTSSAFELQREFQKISGES
ncbi:MAG: PspC domain-containing protein [Pseudomonadota bacterium]